MIHLAKKYNKHAWVLIVTSLMLMGSFSTGANEPLKITVYGASGHIGSRIVTEALERGHYVTGVSRNPAKLKNNKHERFQAVQGDILNVESITRIIAGQDIVIKAIADDSSNKDPAQHAVRRSAETLVTSLRQLGDKAPRLIAVIGAATLEMKPGVLMFDTMDLKPGSGPMVLITGHKLAYDFYKTSTDVKWTIASPSRYIEPGERTGKFRLGGNQILRKEDGKLTNISTEDFAVAIIDEAEQGKYIRKQFTVGY